MQLRLCGYGQPGEGFLPCGRGDIQRTSLVGHCFRDGGGGQVKGIFVRTVHRQGNVQSGTGARSGMRENPGADDVLSFNEGEGERVPVEHQGALDSAAPVIGRAVFPGSGRCPFQRTAVAGSQRFRAPQRLGREILGAGGPGCVPRPRDVERNQVQLICVQGLCFGQRNGTGVGPVLRGKTDGQVAPCSEGDGFHHQPHGPVPVYGSQAVLVFRGNGIAHRTLVHVRYPCFLISRKQLCVVKSGKGTVFGGCLGQAEGQGINPCPQRESADGKAKRCKQAFEGADLGGFVPAAPFYDKGLGRQIVAHRIKTVGFRELDGAEPDGRGGTLAVQVDEVLGIGHDAVPGLGSRRSGGHTETVHARLCGGGGLDVVLDQQVRLVKEGQHLGARKAHALPGRVGTASFSVPGPVVYPQGDLFGILQLRFFREGVFTGPQGGHQKQSARESCEMSNLYQVLQYFVS